MRTGCRTAQTIAQTFPTQVKRISTPTGWEMPARTATKTGFGITSNSNTARDGLTDGAEIDVFGTDPLSDDSDGDGISDALELLFSPTSTCEGDLNGDSAVTVVDLLLLLGNVGATC
jgi:hypothetical protein